VWLGVVVVPAEMKRNETKGKTLCDAQCCESLSYIVERTRPGQGASAAKSRQFESKSKFVSVEITLGYGGKQLSEQVRESAVLETVSSYGSISRRKPSALLAAAS
jgi:hypothetical protein